MPTRSLTRFIKSNTYEKLSINLRNPKGVPLPPSISPANFNVKSRFDPNTVISRFSDGSICSRYSDPSWYFTHMARTPIKHATMHFPKDKSLAEEVKTILKLIMLTPTQDQLDLSQVINIYYLLKRLADFCINEKISLKKLFNKRGGIRLISLIKDQIPFYAQEMIKISDYLNFMSEEAGFEHNYNSLSKSTQARLRKIAQEHKLNTKQNPVIPSKILRSIYHDTITEYEELLPVLDELLAMQAEVDLHPMIGCSLSYQKSYSSKLCGTSYAQLKTYYPNNYDLAIKYPLAREFLNHYFIKDTPRPLHNRHSFIVMYDRTYIILAINYIQRVCQDIIIMFTGMRPIEAALLPYFGCKETTVDGVKYWLIYGFAVKKRNNTPPFEMWVTNEYGYNAFQTAKLIADLYYKHNQRQPIDRIPDEKFTPELSPLFLRDNGKIDKRFSSNKKTPALTNSYTITKTDFDELLMIDPHRKWEGETDYAIGRPFPVKLSYFRRSIAFFASASGVRLVDLKNQLHHLFDSQTFYYGQGSGRSNPFLQNKDSFASYFNQIKHEAEAFSFIKDVIDFDGKLFGASSFYADRNKEFYNTIREEDRSETIKRFKRGELSYKDTHLGGCKTLIPCKNRALGSVTACLECKDADIKPEKLAHAINDQALLVNSLDYKRLEFRTEIHELIKMIDYAIKNISNSIKYLNKKHCDYNNFKNWLKEFKLLRQHYLRELKKYGWKY